jgi:peptide/nickel transport system substrate-binding protein
VKDRIVRFRSAGLLIASLVLLIAAPALAPAQERVLVWADGTDVATLDGGFIVDLAGTTLLKHVAEHLVRLTPDLAVQPGLAESWSTAKDGVTWTFRLRSGPKFSSGAPVTARAVKFNLDRIADPKTAAPNRPALAQIASVEAVDDRTLRIVTKQPFPDLLQALADRAGAVLDPAEVTKHPVREVGRHPVGSGPFRVTAWTPGQQIVLERNPHWWGPRPEIDRIVYRVVPEANTRLAMVRRREADIISKPPLEALPELERDPQLRVVAVDGIQAMTLEILTDKKPLDDVRVRRAIAHAVDKRALIEGLMRGLASDHCSPVTPGVGRQFVAPQPCPAYDPAQAKKLLAEAGHPSGFDMEFWTSNGRYTKDREVGEAVQAMLADVGIRAKLTTWEWASYTQKWAAPDRSMWMIGRSAGFTDFIFTRQFARASWDSGANNNTRFQDPRVEELLVKARQEMDPKLRIALYRQIQEIVWAAMPIIPLYTSKVVMLTRADVSGLVVLPNEEITLTGVKRARR